MLPHCFQIKIIVICNNPNKNNEEIIKIEAYVLENFDHEMLLNWLKIANNPFRFLFCYTSVFVGNMPENNIFERLECRNPVTNYPCKQRN